MTAQKNFHAGSRSSQDYLYDVDVPTPTHAERARTMVAGISSGTLCTVSCPGGEVAGYPYGSLVTTALHGGQPLFLISALAEHTRNLHADPRASLLLSEGGEDTPLALGRITLVGDCVELGKDAGDAKQAYLRVHPQAEYYLGYGDFSFWRLDVKALRYIGGFGRMSWVGLDEWLAAEPDPLAAAARGIIDHMNDDHAEALTAYCRAFSKAKELTAVKMTGVDRYGFEMSVETPEGWRPVRLGFSSTLSSPDEVRAEMVAMVKRARARLAT